MGGLDLLQWSRNELARKADVAPRTLVFLCARGGKLVVTELDRLPPESTEVVDPGVVGLAAADLVDVYVAAREST